MTTLSYAVDVFNAGTTSYSTGAIEFVLGLADLERPPTIIGPVVRPLEGRTESRSWTVDVVDAGGTFTARLADASGRPDLLNRVVRVRRTLDGVTAAIGAGRLRDVALADSVAGYRLTVEHEHVLARSALVFTTNTTRLFPPGPHAAYGPFAAPPKGEVFIGGYISLGGTRMFRAHFEAGWVPLTDLGLEAIKADVLHNQFPNSGNGNFGRVRLRVGNSTYRVASFGTVFNPTFSNPGGGMPDPNPVAGLDENFSQNGGHGGPTLWAIVSSSTAFAVGQSYSSAFLHMFSAPPSEATPLHIGTSAGLHPMTLKRQLWAGSHSSAGAPKVRYSTAAFNNGTTGLELVPMPKVRFRITEPQPLGRWVEDHLNAPFGVVDFLDSSGRLAPRRILLPNSTAGITFTFTQSNLREPHPGWVHPGREMVTALQIEHTDEQWVVGGLVPGLIAQWQRPTNASADFIRATPRTTEVFHDRVAKLGYRPLRIAADGLHTRQYGIFDYPFTPTPDPNLQAVTATLRREAFDRYGDGPIVGALDALSAASTVAEGDFVRVVLGTYPNVGTGARGGTRLVQILSKEWHPDGYRFDYLDAGANLNPLAAPTISLGLSTVNKKHVVNATVGGVASSAGFQLEAAISATTAAPAATSSLWTRVLTSALSTGVYPITARPSGSKTWARVRATAALRIRSSWRVSAAGVTTSSMAAPTITMSSVKARTALATLAPGETLYPTQVFADTSTSATFGNANLVATVPAGTRSYRYAGLTANTKHLVGARHVDPYGGLSGADSTTLTTLTTGSSGNFLACPPLGGLALGYPSA